MVNAGTTGSYRRLAHSELFVHYNLRARKERLMLVRKLLRSALMAALLAAGVNPAAAGEMERLDKADARLNEDYRALMGTLSEDEEGTARLKRAQRAWIAFRDAECTFNAQWTEGGTIHSRIVAGCMADLTEQRADQLEAYLNCEEGDLTCPPPPQ